MNDIAKDVSQGSPGYYRLFRGTAAVLGGDWLGRRRVDPNKVTLTGTGLCLVACVVWALHVYWGPLFWIGLAVAVGGAWLDMIDGHVARVGGRETDYGEQLDSTMDRIVDGCMWAAVAYAGSVLGEGPLAVLGCSLAMISSFVVSYSRAKAENLKLSPETAKAGHGGRGERLGLLGVGVLLTKLSFVAEHHGWIGFHLYYSVWGYAVAVLATSTIFQRQIAMKNESARRPKP